MVAAGENAGLTEEWLTMLIKNIFKKKIWTPTAKYHKHNKWKLFYIQIREIRGLKAKLPDLKQNLELTEDTLEENVYDLKWENMKLKTKMKELHEHQL